MMRQQVKINSRGISCYQFFSAGLSEFDEPEYLFVLLITKTKRNMSMLIDVLI